MSQLHGKPLSISVKPNKKLKTNDVLPAKDIIQLQVDCNFSDREMLGIAKAIRKGFNNRKIIEDKFKDKLVGNSHILDNYFECREFNFLHIKKNITTEIKETAIICKNLGEFINFVLEKRNVYDYHLKFGIDGGGGFLKICLSIQSKNFEDVDISYKNSKNVKKFKDSGVKKVFIIGISPSMMEKCQILNLEISCQD